MSPTLQRIVLNGASRHRIDKGLFLLGNTGQSIPDAVRDQVVRAANDYFHRQSDLMHYHIEVRANTKSVLGLVSPFLPVHTPKCRDEFITRLARAIATLQQIASQNRCTLTAAGINPLFPDTESQIPALCSDLHQIEVYDAGEIERIYNLLRQFLPELLAISTHSAVYGGTLQRDFSLRMRINPASFLPRYLSQFSMEHLDKIRSMMRKEFGLADLKQMDINPLAGDSKKLDIDNPPLFTQNPAALEIRFVDSQICMPFIRAQIILFQAIAMYGRNLARRGKRTPYMRDEVIDENKALAIQSGPSAILTPDEKFKKDDGNRGFSYHDRGKPERATTALWMTINGLLLPYLRELKCEYSEVAPIMLGTELRKLGRQCFANYAEYQKYLFYTYPNRFQSVFHQQSQSLMSSPTLDYITEFNRSTYQQLATEIEESWSQKLKPLPRVNGRVIWYDAKDSRGRIRSDSDEEFVVQKNDVEGTDTLYPGQEVSFEANYRENRSFAVRVRPGRMEGSIFQINFSKGFGFIKSGEPSDVYFQLNDVRGDLHVKVGDVVTYGVMHTEKGVRAVQIDLVRAAPEKTPYDNTMPRSDLQTRQPRLDKERFEGHVRKFDEAKGYGFIRSDSGRDVFVHQSALRGIKSLVPNQRVSFELEDSPKGPRAVFVKIIEEGEQ